MNETTFKNKILCGDVLELIKTIPDEHVNCVVTSPPYYGLRDYGCDGQIGLEETPEMYVEKLVDLFREIRRVLKKDGNVWLNLGDSYASSTKSCGRNDTENMYGKKSQQLSTNTNIIINHGLKPKDLIGIPWRVAFALQADGWYLRQDIIWHKPNPMPESVTDRCTKAHEYIFLLSKSVKYYYDSEVIKEDAVDPGSYTGRGQRNAGKMYQYDKKHYGMSVNENGKLTVEGKVYEKVNKRSVWTVTTKPYKEAHFATYPQDLIKPCILAGCPENGIVLDPFMGAGTTAVVARKLNRNYLGIELNPEYVRMAEERIYNELGMFK